jgi:hypothetical protein
MKERWAELQVGGIEIRVIIRVVGVDAGGAEGSVVEDLAERGDAQSARQVIVERRERDADRRAVVGTPGIRRHEPAPSHLEVEPVLRTVTGAERRGEAERRASRGGPLADVGDPHAADDAEASMSSGTALPGGPATVDH